MTVDELRRVYSRIYSIDKVIHPIKGRLDPYGSDAKRDSWFLDFLKNHVRLPAEVLDASCGRGHLLRKLIDRGYNAIGTEFVQNKDIAGLPVKILAYHDLVREFGVASFDVVISNDVLEHLESEDAAIQGIKDLAAMSRKWVLISVGVGCAPKYPAALKIKEVNDLHLVKRPVEWWESQVSKFVDLEFSERHGSWYGFGTKSV